MNKEEPVKMSTPNAKLSTGQRGDSAHQPSKYHDADVEGKVAPADTMDQPEYVGKGPSCSYELVSCVTLICEHFHGWASILLHSTV
jgi:hypothetical protein